MAIPTKIPERNIVFVVTTHCKAHLLYESRKPGRSDRCSPVPPLPRVASPQGWTLSEGPVTMDWWRGSTGTASTPRFAGPWTSTDGRYPSHTWRQAGLLNSQRHKKHTLQCGCYQGVNSNVNMRVVFVVIRLVCCVLWQSGLGCLSEGPGLSYVY